jgi:DNA mismatch endonuclease (patch repair protein)
MRRVRSSGTTPELRLEKALRAAGLRFQRHAGRLPGKPDIVFPSKRLAVFVDGEFWHGIQWQKRGLARLEEQFVDNPAKEYWIAKITRNINRDRAATSALLDAGWTVLRFWEGDVRRDVEQCVAAIVKALRKPSASPAALALLKTFVALKPVPRSARRALEILGWQEAEASEAALTLAPFPLTRVVLKSPFVIIEAGVRLAARNRADLTRALNRRGYGVGTFEVGAPRRLFIVGVHGGPRFRNFPIPDRGDSPLAWIVASYIDPAVTEMIRGVPLTR